MYVCMYWYVCVCLLGGVSWLASTRDAQGWPRCWVLRLAYVVLFPTVAWPLVQRAGLGEFFFLGGGEGGEKKKKNRPSSLFC